MDDLIEALQIFKKYMPDPNTYSYRRPINCQHDEMMFCAVGGDDVSEEDRERLEELGFFADGEYFSSFRFGRC